MVSSECPVLIICHMHVLIQVYCRDVAIIPTPLIYAVKPGVVGLNSECGLGTVPEMVSQECLECPDHLQ